MYGGGAWSGAIGHHLVNGEGGEGSLERVPPGVGGGAAEEPELGERLYEGGDLLKLLVSPRYLYILVGLWYRCYGLYSLGHSVHAQRLHHRRYLSLLKGPPPPHSWACAPASACADRPRCST